MMITTTPQLLEALVNLVRTTGISAPPFFGKADKTLMSGIAALILSKDEKGDGESIAEESEIAAAQAVAVIQELSIPKCAGCGGGPDLTRPFRAEQLSMDDEETLLLKAELLEGARTLAEKYLPSFQAGAYKSEVMSLIRRIIFAVGEDFSEDDLFPMRTSLEAYL